MSESEIYTVSQVTFAIKKQLESSFLAVRVRGEISNLKVQSSGHIYFTLKDPSAQMSAVLFQGNAKSLSRPLKEGDRIIVEGEISVYVPRGTYQIVVRKVLFDGVGDLLLQLHRLKEELKQIGYFDSLRKKPLPLFPKTIGIVTSPTGAVIRDILHVLSRRVSSFNLILNPVKVQGVGASKEIADAVRAFNEFGLADVIIVCRGGGSLEDLFAFNEREVADAIFHSKIPVISAVGHETDFSISDFVADVRAPTPSAAAEIVLQETSGLKKHLLILKRRIQETLLGQIKQHRLRLERFKVHPKMKDPYSLLGTFEQKLDDLSVLLDERILRFIEERRTSLSSKRALLQRSLPTRQIEQDKKRLSLLTSSLDSRIDHLLKTKKERLNALISHLGALNPKSILKKGYCICFEENTNSVIIGARSLTETQKISLLMHDGAALAEVKKITYG